MHSQNHLKMVPEIFSYARSPEINYNINTYLALSQSSENFFKVLTHVLYVCLLVSVKLDHRARFRGKTRMELNPGTASVAASDYLTSPAATPGNSSVKQGQ